MSRPRSKGATPVGLAWVQGRSMEPVLAEGDLLLVRHGIGVRPGLLVLARFPDGMLVVKRVAGARSTRTGSPGWWLLSDNPGEGVDSRHRGVIADEDVVAVVLARLWPSPRRARRLGRTGDMQT